MLLMIILSSITSCDGKDPLEPDSPDTPTGPTYPTTKNLCEHAWESRDVDINISSSEDYADITETSTIFYFLNDKQGVCRFNLKVSDTEGDSWGTKNEYTEFEYNISGVQINIRLLNRLNADSYHLKMSEDKLYDEDMTFTRRSITDSDRMHMPLSGNCGKEDANVVYTYWPWGEIRLDGSGEMQDFEPGKQPWANRRVTEVLAENNSKIESIGANFLNGFAELEWVQLTSSVKKIGAHAFENCISLERINGSNFEPELIDDYAFAGCTHLQSDNCSKVKRIGNYAYFCCSEMSILHEMEVVEEIGASAFFECSSIKKLKLPETLKIIGNSAFVGIDVSKIILPENLETLGEGVFMGKINEIYIGKSLKTFNQSFITDLEKGTISINQSTAPKAEDPLSIAGAPSSSYSKWTLKVPVGATSSYKNHAFWKKFNIQEDPLLTEQGNDPNPGGDDNPVTGNEEERLDIEYAKDSKRGPVSTSFKGDGTSANPYLVQSAADLRYLSDCVRKGETFKGVYFRQTNDIVINRNVLTKNGDLNGSGNNFEQWIPIGRQYPSYFFCGKYYGENYTISGLYYNRENGEYGGLFGRVGGTGSVYNVIIKDSFFKGKNNIGALIGDVSINRVSSTIPTAINSFYEKNLMVSSVYNISYATVIGSGNNIGGIIGSASFSGIKAKNNGHFIWIMQCANYGYVKGTSSVGGIVGEYASYSNTEGKLTALYNEGQVYATSGCAGGIIGKITSAPCKGALNKGTVNGSLQSGGIFGYGIGVALSGCLNFGGISSTGKRGAICGYVRSGKLEYSYYLKNNDLPKCGQNQSATFTQVIACTEAELKSAKIRNALNNHSTASFWVAGPDGFPILEWLTKPTQTKY